MQSCLRLWILCWRSAFLLWYNNRIKVWITEQMWDGNILALGGYWSQNGQEGAGTADECLFSLSLLGEVRHPRVNVVCAVNSKSGTWLYCTSAGFWWMACCKFKMLLYLFHGRSLSHVISIHCQLRVFTCIVNCAVSEVIATSKQVWMIPFFFLVIWTNTRTRRLWQWILMFALLFLEVYRIHFIVMV